MLVWIGFLLFIFVLLALDLGVFHRRAHVISVREALSWTVIWIVTALAFSGFVYLGYEHHWLGLGLQPDAVERSALHPDGEVNDARSALLKFLTGYVVELSLSADNVFVIAMLFSSFGIPRIYQHRVLFWGILGALAMRGAMIAIGARLVAEFSWVLPLFGVVLILTAVKMTFMGVEPGDPERNRLVRLMRRFLPLTTRFDGEHFFVRTPTDEVPALPAGGQEGTIDTAVKKVRRGWMLTPLAPALVMVETTDLVFAVDSIPAIFAITADPFLVFTSNVFAILGLRSLYFALAGALHAFHYMKHALAVVLLMVGVKMLAHSWLHQALGPDFNLWLLAAVVTILGIGGLVSIVELRWGTTINRTISSAVRQLWDWIAPDRMMTTILRAGRRSVAKRSTSHARRLSARRAAVTRARRVRKLTRAWRSLWGRPGHPHLIFVAHRLAEEGEHYLAYL